MKGLLTIFLNLIKLKNKIALFFKGKSQREEIEKRITTGKAWEEFCDTLKAAGGSLMYSGTPKDAFQQAEGIRYLSRLTRAGLEAFVEYDDPQFPVFRRMVHETVKMGADNPDNYYLNAQIDGTNEYIIKGKRNTIHYFGIFSQNGNYGTTGGLSPCGVLEDDQLVVDEDGNFEIYLGLEKRGSNWLKIEPETSLLMVRQTFFNRQKEVPVELSISMVNAPERPEPLTAERINNALNTAGLFVGGASLLFSRWAARFQKHTNKLPLFDPEVSNAAGGDARITYYHSHWKLGPGEALIICTAIPACDSWNFQLNNYWMESLDYRYFNVCINAASATLEEDGTVKVIVCADDPGHPNWLETAGHNEGTMCWRWYRPQQSNLPEPYVEVVNSSEIVNISEINE